VNPEYRVRLRRLPYNCPDCQERLAHVQACDHATQVVKRTCPACRQRWQIVVKPVRSALGWLDFGTFTRVPKKIA
jgi:transcription elongation factor Elf1